MTRSAFLRARRPEHKQQRREAILAAARELAGASGVRNVSLGAVAEAVGLAKSNIVRYFGTREEIYLDLAAEEWRQWGEECAGRLRAATGRDDAVMALAETLGARRLFLDLLGHTATSLEHNVSVPAARTFKRAIHAVIDDLGPLVARPTGLTDLEGKELVTAAAGLAGMLYPAANPPPTIVELYAQDPDLAAACPQLVPTLTRALKAFAAGLPTLREPAE
ncbi:DNA-binding transcriptional regulator, AcrR family [Nonomuraea solani]|uniref:DNA-binding transcriptional regulator, AcrR family n=1 Tax=Nonomuraea solani TaxID=1144553 RepID=A0A1H6EW16_9ACTN|nr:TetR family transcriptional regulator [Nonomuraea solani]SEH01613.1 DNA-binding transcriptional regulator, AcrR family [Nonomuraea solani]